ncbi:MAG: 2-oxo-4-hydroxy-4-carboxy-5-ureidoimidazoline decarboxylase [Micromonosporaceae bacterium]|nr:2-oxo-4-hydroxy-4-carboxy-5-ureidoimidazoline decarboxylase [Micromonosporaceae bacterium]
MLAWFNALPGEQAERELLACCAAPAWARAVAAGRPYPDLAAVLAAAAAAGARRGGGGGAAALAAHPRIGQRPAGSGREAAWSRQEQSGMDAAAAEVAAALAAANSAYEQRFGHVFLIFAAGRTPEQMLAAARARLGNDPATERDVVREELRKIARLRLERLLS